MFKFAAPIGAIAVALVSVPAIAQPDRPPSIRVEYKDLNLNNADGRKELNWRIKVAAQKVCPSEEFAGSRIPRENVCYEQAMKSVDNQLAEKGLGAGITAASP